jgi:hypothetical protein
MRSIEPAVRVHSIGDPMSLEAAVSSLLGSGKV